MRVPLRGIEMPRPPRRHDPLLWLLLGLTIAGDLASVASLLLLFFKR